MPWTPKDASAKTKQAKSPAAKKVWSSVANNVLAKTSDDGRAIRELRAKGLTYKTIGERLGVGGARARQMVYRIGRAGAEDRAGDERD